MDAARGAFELMFPGEELIVVGVSAPSGVPDQPTSDGETFLGAKNRAAHIRENELDADYWIAFEGGIEDTEEGMRAFAWVVIHDAEGRTGKGRTATLFLPPAVAEHIRNGKELGEADDLVFGMTNSKQQTGAVGILTKDLVTRASYYVDGAVLALIPFKNSNLY